MKARWWVPFAFLAPALLGLVTFRFAPIVIAAVGSFYGTTLRGESVFLGLRNYTELFEDPAFWSTISTALILQRRQDVISQMRGGLHHAPRVTRRATRAAALFPAR